jgi:sporulation protein YpjB
MSISVGTIFRPRPIGSAVLLLAMLTALFGAATARVEAAPATGAGDAVSAFRSAADSLYDALTKGNRLEASRSLTAAERAFRALPMTTIPTAEGVEALAGSVAEMKRAWAALQPDEQRLERAAGALRLAADALARPEEPMWLQYKPLLLDDADRLAAELNGNAAAPSGQALAALERIQTRYALIRAAALLTREPSAVERADSVIRYAERVMKADKPNPALLAGIADPVRQALAALFPAQSEPQTAVPALMPPTWGFAATIGSFIVTILSWAGWRRFRYDRAHPKR